jgi:hypothetical protein
MHSKKQKNVTFTLNSEKGCDVMNILLFTAMAQRGDKLKKYK